MVDVNEVGLMLLRMAEWAEMGVSDAEFYIWVLKDMREATTASHTS